MKKKSAGFTFIETLVGVLIFSISMLYGLSFFTYGKQALKQAQNMRYALDFAGQKIEYLKTVDYYSLPSSTSSSAVSAAGITYSFAANTCEYIVAATSDQYKIVSATVTWQSNSLTLATILAP